MDLQLAGRAYLVTGSTRGLGRAIAHRLAEEGADVAVCGRDAGGVERELCELAGAGVRTHGVTIDVTANGASERLVAECVEAFGRLDGIVANAGGAVGEPRLADVTGDDWAATYRWNVIHAVDLVRAARSVLAAADGGSAVLIGSISAALPSPWPQYAAAKAALEAAARSLAAELAPDGIRVNCVRPGSMLFEGGAWEAYANAEPEAYRTFVSADLPAGRLGSPETVADVVAFVLSPRAAWINGAVIPVDGGQRRSSPYPSGKHH